MSLLDDVSIVVTPNGYKAGELYAVKPTFALGSELVTNSIFNSDNTSDWGNGFYDSFTFDSSEGGFYNLQRVTADARTNINLSSVLTVGKRYKVTVVARGSGNIKTGLTTSGYTTQPSAIFTLTSSFASYSTIVTVTSGLVYGVLWNDDGNSNIDYQSYSVKEYTSADMDVTRETAATRVDEDGLVNYAEVLGDEEITDGDFPTGTTNWTIEDVWTISGNSANGNGANGSSQQLVQSSVFTIGKTYKVTYDIINYVSGSVFMPNVGSSNSGNQTYSEYITATQSDFKITGINFYGSITNISVKEVTRDNVPRIDYTGGGCPHILAEPQRTNLVTYSSDFSNAAWTKSNSTIDSNATVSPDGTENASKLTVMVAAYSGIYETGDAAVNKYSMSVFAKKGDKDWLYFVDSNGTTLVAWFNLSNGTLGTITNGTATIEDFGNGWYRCIYSDTNNVSNVYFQMGLSDANNAYIPSSGGYAYIWAASKEVGSYATSYIPTNGESGGVTRNQDIFTRDGIGSLINSTEGVLFAEIAALSDDSVSRKISLNSGTFANQITVSYGSGGSNIIQCIIYDGTNVVVNMSYSSTNITDFNKIAIKYISGNTSLWVNGVEVDTDNAAFSGLSLSALSFDNGSSTNFFYGKVKQLQVYNTALTDEQLLQLTGTSGTDFYESYAEMASALTYTIQ